MRYLLYLVLLIISLSSCSVSQHTYSTKGGFDVQLDTNRLFDQSRQREIPVALYQPITNETYQKIVIFSHGYGHNYQKNYLVYSYLTNYLASKGYFVVSIQHELPTDSILPFTGIPQVVRLPFWERGVENIQFVINSLKTSNPSLDFEHITLIGHSNGGDMVALFPSIYPNYVERIITLDHLRVPLPMEEHLSVFSLRSNDKYADTGVLPSEIEQQSFGIKIIKLEQVNHNNMNDFAKKSQKKLILSYINDFMSH